MQELAPAAPSDEQVGFALPDRHDRVRLAMSVDTPPVIGPDGKQKRDALLWADRVLADRHGDPVACDGEAPEAQTVHGAAL